ncbi:MAG TPA: hypothetical protein VK451_12280 [Methyloceanibacter sp.]|nr:hypothetical protein [Methyloceanibacter sp.]
MAQEQAKTPPAGAAQGAKDDGKLGLEGLFRPADSKPGEAPNPERSAELPRRSTLAERLRAEQRKREEPKRDDTRRDEAKRDDRRDELVKRDEARRDEQLKRDDLLSRREPREPREEPKQEEAKGPLEFAETTPPPSGAGAPKQFTRTRRPAGPPPQRRLAPPANDDLPSIGGLIFALQQRPSRTPFLVALAASVVWFIIGGFFAFGLISAQIAAGGVSGLLGSASALTAAVAILVPITIFWFLALLVWRAQELRLMASAMTEVAVRLAEPDKLAEQSVASVGQTIRRQVAAMNDAISRAIGRASELEAMVHSEVAALERSYGENELRVRTLISELATEREALANNSARVSDALKGVGAQVARDIAAASSTIDKKLAERGTQLTELLVSRSSEAAEQVHKAQSRVTEAIPGLLDRLTKEQGRLTQVIDGATQNLAALETVVVQRTSALDKTMKERTEALQGSLAARIKGLETSVAQGAILLDKTMKDRTDAFTASIGQGANIFEKTLKDRTESLTGTIAQGAVALDKALKDRTDALVGTIGQGAVVLDKTLKERTDVLTNTIGQGAVLLDKTFKDRTDGFVTAVGQGAGGLDRMMRERTAQLTNLVSQGAVALEKTLKDRTEVLTGTIAQGSVLLDRTLNDRIGHFNAMVDQRALLLDKQIVDRTNSFTTALDQRAGALDKALHDRTTQFVTAINQGATSLDKTLSERAESFTTSLFQRVRALEQAITQQTGSLDKTMTERAQAVIMALAERLQAIDTTFNQRASETERMLGEHARSTQDAFAKQTAQLNQVLANNSAMMQQTANQVGAQSKEAVGVLTSQTQTLREVSRGLLDQIHGLTQRFENQGQAILTAAKALDSSNTKIDSILEGRHQAIIALLHTVNTKAQDLDNMMRSYAGMMENTLSQAEHRAKQVGTALARDTAGQAQAALTQIERLREEAQSHTNRAVADLKGSFEQIITQIGRQLEQMRGQFDTTSRGMHEVAKKTASDLDGLRQEMQKRMETLPEHTAQTTAAIRKALDQQVKEIEQIAPVLTKAATQAVAQAAPVPPAPIGGFDLPPVGRSSGGFTPREDARPATGQYDIPPMPKFDVRGRQVASGESGDLDQVTNSLAQQLGGASYSPQGGGRGGNFGMSAMPEQGYGGGQSFGNRGVQQASSPLGGGNQLRLDELARAIDQRTASDVWYRFRSGDRGALGRHIYSLDGQATFDEIARRYDRDADFRGTVDRYIGDFERLLGEAEASDPDGRMLQNYLVSETGRVYLLLAHASGRLR